MLIIPAIDLHNGKVVRFIKGNPKNETVYSDNPLGVARKWQEEGAKIIHIVDLSAALGESDNLSIIEHIIKEIGIKVEVGGGMRDIDKAVKLVRKGVERIIVGTKSLDNVFLGKLLSALGPKRIAVSVDIKDGLVATKGWQEKSLFKPFDFMERIVERGIKWIIYTDISRDGTLKGVNVEALRGLSAFKGVNFIISGGVSGVSDLEKLKKEVPFVWGIISGKALYEGKLNLPEAISLLEKQ